MHIEETTTKQSARRWSRGMEHGNVLQALLSLRQVIFMPGVQENNSVVLN